MSFRNRIYSLTDTFARQLPSPLIRLFSAPINYHISSVDNFIYESARMINTAFAFCMNNKISGDYAEFGVYQGRTTREAYFASKRTANSCKFHIFDSFQGLPESEGVFHTGQFACSRDVFESNMRSTGIDFSRLTITEGFFDETLPKVKTETPIAIAWIDCDLYDSTVPVLEFLKDRLVNGSVLIFDDWFCLDQKGGEQRACKEWLEANPHISLTEYQNFHWAGKSFIVSIDRSCRLPDARAVEANRKRIVGRRHEITRQI